jgi:hypothetical protein
MVFWTNGRVHLSERPVLDGCESSRLNFYHQDWSYSVSKPEARRLADGLEETLRAMGAAIPGST